MTDTSDPIGEALGFRLQELVTDKVKAFVREETHANLVAAINGASRHKTKITYPENGTKDIIEFYRELEEIIDLGVVNMIAKIFVIPLHDQAFKKRNCYCLIAVVEFTSRENAENFGRSFLHDGSMNVHLPDIENPEGVFMAELKISYWAMTESDKRSEGRDGLLRRLVKDMLDALPPGTEVVEFRDLAMTGLSHDTEITFRNNGLKNVKYIDTMYYRYIEKDPEVPDRFHEKNVMTHIKYMDGDRNEVLPKFVRE